MRKIEIKINNVFDWTECDMKANCLGMDKAAIVFEREKDQIFYRQSFNGSLTFNDKLVNGIQVFTEVSTLNLSVADERTRVLLRVTLDDVVWYGFFTPRNCNWDYNRRTFTVNPKTDDVYEPFLDSTYEINLAQSASYDVAYIYESVAVRISNYGKLFRSALGTVITGNSWSNNFIIENLQTTFFDEDINPVTGEANIYKQMVLIQKTNAKRILEPDLVEASRQMFSFQYAMKLCRNVFNVYWDLEYLGLNPQGIPLYKFVLEHKSYFETVGTVHDLTETTGTTATDKFYYDEDNVPKKINIKLDAEEGLEIKYLSGLTGDEKDIAIQDLVLRVWRWEGEVTTSDDGFFLHTYSAPLEEWYDYTVQSIYMATLMPKFHIHGREYYYGRINDTLNVIFESVTPSILQDIQIKKCVAFQTNDYCDTTLTSILGEYGKVVKAEYKMNGGTSLTLAYSKEAINLISFNVSLRTSISGVNIGSGIIGYSAMFYPGNGDAVELGVNIRVFLIDIDTSVTSEECIDTIFGSTNNGGRTSFSTLWSGKQITGYEVYLDIPEGWDVISNVPLEEAEVCS